MYRALRVLVLFYMGVVVFISIGGRGLGGGLRRAVSSSVLGDTLPRMRLRSFPSAIIAFALRCSGANGVWLGWVWGLTSLSVVGSPRCRQLWVRERA